MRKIESSLRSREKSSSLLFSSSLSISCFRSSDQEPGREASERGTKLLAPELLSSSFEGQVHAPGRGTKDGFAAFDALLGRWTSWNRGRFFRLFLLLSDPRPQTPDPFFAIHQSLFTNHQPPILRSRSGTGATQSYWPPKATGIAKRYWPA